MQATAKFQFAVPHVLQSASPSLAALHATRARLIHHPAPARDTLASSHCTRCGAFLLDGSSRIRVVRISELKRKKPKGNGDAGSAEKDRPQRVLRKLCGTCGLDEDVPIEENASARDFPMPRKRKRTLAAPAPPVPPFEADIDRVQAVSGPASTKRTSTPSSRPSLPQRPPTGTNPSSAPPVALPQARPKARPKKKAGLQDLLARNRERQEQQKKKSDASGGLSAFLESL